MDSIYNRLAGKTLDTLGVWTEANQRVLGQIVDFGAGVAREGVRLSGDLARIGLATLRDGQAACLGWQRISADASGDPAAWYQKAVAECVGGTEKVFRLAEEQAQALTRAAERVQAGAEQAGKDIQETYAGAVSKMKEIYAGS